VRLHGALSQKGDIFILATMRTRNLLNYVYSTEARDSVADVSVMSLPVCFPALLPPSQSNFLSCRAQHIFLAQTVLLVG
jgi:hypothetical protein